MKQTYLVYRKIYKVLQTKDAKIQQHMKTYNDLNYKLRVVRNYMAKVLKLDGLIA